jgi:aminodeoxychorismate synthase component I
MRSERLGRYSFVGADPYALVRVRGRRIEIECLRSAYDGMVPGLHSAEGPVLEVLRRLMPKPPSAKSALPFVGGAVGWLGYELAESFDVHHLRGRDDLGLADAALLLVDALVAFDHASGVATIEALGFGTTASEARAHAERAAARLEAQLRRTGDRPSTPAPRARPHSRVDVDAVAHARDVSAIQKEIAAGNVYQACLTHRRERSFEGDPFELYGCLREINPAPFACYFELPEVAVVGSSPERFLRVTPEGEVEARPIKGTAARAIDAARDAERRQRLAASDKDRAENLMIVDLVRNDLGRVCEPGSVRVPELMAIETYASVFQMVSTVRGRLRDGCDALDAVAATFPPGSMTGAPKIAAMQLLDRLEPLRRGIYSGAIGYLDVRGGADLSVVIRTLLVKEGRAYLHAGGGIVADSCAEAEYREALDKLGPLLRALERARRPDARGVSCPPPSSPIPPIHPR